MISRTIVFCDRDWGQENQMLCTELADWMLGENDAHKNFFTNSFYPRILLMARLTSRFILEVEGLISYGDTVRRLLLLQGRKERTLAYTHTDSWPIHGQ